MKNMTDKTKRNLVITGSLLVSAVLVVLISGAFKTAPTDDVTIPDSSHTTPSVVIEKPDNTEKENEISVPDIVIPEATENPNGDDEGTDQTIQPDVPQKPSYTEEELTNPNQKPSGEKVEPPTEEKPTQPQTQEPPKEKPSKPTGGLPGFDNVPNMGENSGEYLDDMYENGNKVGIMD